MILDVTATSGTTSVETLRGSGFWRVGGGVSLVKTLDPVATHASWMENFPWTRLPGVTPPSEPKGMLDMARYARLDPAGKKTLVGDGNFGGLYQRSDDDMLALWEVAVAETRTVIATDWD